MTSSLVCFLYSSRLAPSYDVEVIGQIVKQARHLNAIHGITGALVFDGELFAQYFEGHGEQVASLISKLARDPRHTDFRQLYSSANLHERRYEDWSMGYTDIDELELDIAMLGTLENQEALSFFVAALRNIDRL